ncbi:uncharacterized protein LOC135819459 [Sycon ciliatum]|uniref:uncharacterized protein LOC135819459 n=1 Tax=Sycon ciliatum TaxID=27933 RepID=UPI0031F67205
MASAWESPVFTGLLSRMVNAFTPAPLRIECESKGLIKRTQRQSFAALVGPAAQNEALLDALRSGDDESFHVFLDCIRHVEPEASVREILAKLDGVDKLRTAGGARAAEAAGMLAAGATLDRPTAMQSLDGCTDASAGSGRLTGVPVTTERLRADEDLLSEYAAMLVGQCDELKSQTALPGLKAKRGHRVDVRKFFTHVQAVAIGEAEASYETSQDVAVHNTLSQAHRESSFPIVNAVQVLQTEPTIANPEHLDLEKSSMVVSPAGSGKTTLCQMILAQYCDPSPSMLKSRCRFPIYISCRNDRQRLCSTDWCHILALDDPSLDFSTGEQHRVLKVLRQNSDSLLLIVDGLDEAGIDEFPVRSCFRETAYRKRKAFVGSHLLLTGRPCKLASTLVEHCDAFFRLTGFSQAQLEGLFCQILGDPEGRKCWSSLQEEGMEHVKEAVLSIPLMAALMCELHDSHHQVLPRCNASLYGQFLDMNTSKRHANLRPYAQKQDPTVQSQAPADPAGGILSRLMNRLSNSRAENPHRSGKSELVSGSFQDRFGEAALKSLREKTSLTATRLLSAEQFETACDLGLLTSTERSHVSEKYSFLHQTFHEFFAAHWLAHQQDPVHLAKICAQSDQIGVSEATRPFWKFVCGLVPVQHLPSIFKCIRDAMKAAAVWPANTNQFLLACFSEASERCRQNRLNASPSSQRIEQQHLVTAARCVCAETLYLNGIELSTLDGLSLKDLLVTLGQLKELDLSGSLLGFRHVGAALVQNVTTLGLNGVSLHGDPITQLSHWLCTTESRLTDLHLFSCGFQTTDASAIAHCLRSQQLRCISLSCNAFSKEFLSQVVEAMQGYSSSVVTLWLGNCSLPSGCGELIASLVELLPRLTTLGMSGNHITSRDAALVLDAVKSHDQIKISFSDNQLDDSIGDCICSIFAYRATSHERLDTPTANQQGTGYFRVALAGNSISLECLQKVAQCGMMAATDWVSHNMHCMENGQVIHRGEAIVQATNGHTVDIRGNWFGDEGIDYLAPTVSKSTDIRILRLEFNHLSSAGALQLANIALAHNTTLQVLDLQENKIGVSGLVAILEACCLPTSSLRALYIEGNPVFAACDVSHTEMHKLCGILPHTSQLRHLGLARTEMRSEIACAILKALKTNTSLSFLGLSGNHLGDCVASALASILPSNDCLKRVTLSDNDLTMASVEILLSSPSIRKMQCIWVKGNPHLSIRMLRRPLTWSSAHVDASTFLDTHLQ